MAIPDNAPQWLKDADTKDADVIIEIRDGIKFVIWRSGEFLGGRFCSGEFLGGKFSGYFLDGEFRGGRFLGGEFWGGRFWGGEFRDGKFLGGRFLGGELLGGEFRGEKLTKAPYVICGLSWRILITPGQIQIGCQTHKAEDWFKFDDAKISSMHPNALSFWHRNKDAIKVLWELQRKGDV